MTALEKLFAYNAWANTRIIAVAAELDADQLSVPVEGIYGSVLDTARHLLLVEENFLLMCSGESPKYPDDPEFRDIGPRLVAADVGFISFVDLAHDTAFERSFHVPWFKRDFTVEDGLLQAAIHSTEHRSDLAGALTRMGKTIPPLDYIAWVVERAGAPEE